ncbi:MAG: PAS domain-containing protein [Bdellovibrionales bacterium]|nr:PAS domain-containing protein [Bdellovibrionales bacterium]
MSDFSIFNDLTFGVQVIDRSMRYVYLNKFLLKEIDKTLNELQGVLMEEAFPDFDNTEVYREIKESLESSQYKKILNEFNFPDGKQTIYQLEIHPIEDGVIVFSHDITDSQKGENYLRETIKQLELFIHYVAHDLKSPVKRIGMLAENLSLDFKDDLPKQALKIVDYIGSQSRQLNQIIDNFVYLSGVKGKDLKKERFDIVVLAKAVAVGLASQFEEKKIEINWPENGYTVKAYANLTQILLRNLFENVILHGQHNMDFLIIENKNESPIFCIVNSVEADTINENIFEPFVKGPSSRSTGLGLAISKKAVERHNGKIWHDFTKNHFKVYFTLGRSKP